VHALGHSNLGSSSHASWAHPPRNLLFDSVHFDSNSLPFASVIKARLGSRFIYSVF
jgi:hypothetical protein